MAEPKKPATSDVSRSLAKEICAKSSNVVERVVAFNNDDVPRYLENLRTFEEHSKKIRIVVK